MRGKPVDMAKLAAANSHKVAIGNAGLNARGDKVTQHGAVLATREQYMSDYNTSSPQAIRHVGLAGIGAEVILTPSEAVAQGRRQMADAKSTTKRRIADSNI